MEILRRLPRSKCDDPRSWSSSVVIGIGFVVLAMIYSLFVAPLLTANHLWFAPGDVWMAVDGGRYVWHGALGYVYEGTNSYSLPGFFILLAPVSGLIDHFRLIEGMPYPVPRPSAWLIVGPYTMLFGIFLLHAVRRLGWELGIRKRLWLLQFAAVLTVLVPAACWGHFEDVVALAGVLYAVRFLLRQDYTRAALALSVAITCKEWALLVLPFLLVRVPVGRRTRVSFWSVALPAALAAFTLSVDWADSSRDLLFPKVTAAAAIGHAAVFAGWLGPHASLIGRALSLAAAPVFAWVTRRENRPTQLLRWISAVCLLRALLEPFSYSYYWSPALLLIGMAACQLPIRARAARWVSILVAGIWLMPTKASGIGWWAGLAALLVVAFEPPRSFRWITTRVVRCFRGVAVGRTLRWHRDAAVLKPVAGPAD